MKAVIISCFNNYDIRVRYVEEVLSESGYDVVFICSDFDHGDKRNYVIEKDNAIQIKVKQYKKNLSVARIRSHRGFSKSVFKKLFDINPDLIYSIVPPNSLVKSLCRYKKQNHEVKLVYDIFDLWPESLPVSGTIKKILFYWKNLRDKYLSFADKVFIECDLYKKYLPKKNNYITACLCKPCRDICFSHNDEILTFLYLGSINNLIDIDAVVSFLNSINLKRKSRLVIIGKGDKTEELKNRLASLDIQVVDCGAIYDDVEKDKIISECHFGLNIYKKGLTIGLTMKSLEYFCRSLPIINGNIYDTRLIVDKYNCGFDVQSEKDIDNILTNLTETEWSKLSDNTRKAYVDNFSVNKYKELLKSNLI